MKTLLDYALENPMNSDSFWQIIPLGNTPHNSEYRNFPIIDSTRNEHYTIKTRRTEDKMLYYEVTVFDESVLAKAENHMKTIVDFSGQISTSITFKDFNLALRFHYSALKYLNELGF